MTNDEREEMNQLCELIQTEKDHEKFMKLVERLNELLSRHESNMGEHRERSV
jgi:hypothetical protein